jgi:hypothetical protein
MTGDRHNNGTRADADGSSVVRYDSDEGQPVPSCPRLIRAPVGQYRPRGASLGRTMRARLQCFKLPCSRLCQLVSTNGPEVAPGAGSLARRWSIASGAPGH